MAAALNPFKEEFVLIAQKLKLELESASLVKHAGLKGAYIEDALASFLRETIPAKHAVSTNQIVVDCEGRQSNECDIVIHERMENYRYLRRHIPVETVYGVIEVKKHLDAKAAKDFRKKEQNFRALNYRGYHSNGVETELKNRGFHFCPPSFNLFSISSSFGSLERYCAQVFTDPYGNNAWKNPSDYSDSLTYYMSLCCSLDVGIARNSALSGNTFLAIDPTNNSKIKKRAAGKEYCVSEVTALHMFLTFFEHVLESRSLVTPFDHRSYSLFHEEISSGIAPDLDEIAKIISEIQDTPPSK